MKQALTNPISKQFIQQTEKLRDALSRAQDGVIEAGKIVVAMIEEREDAFDILVRERVTTLSILEMLEGVGRGKIAPELVFNPSPLAQKAIRMAVPMAQQREILTKPIPVLVRRGQGYEVEHRRLEEITNVMDASLLIAGGKVRTIEEQRAYLQERELSRSKGRHRWNYEPPDSVSFCRQCRFTVKELEDIVAHVKSQPQYLGSLQSAIQRKQISKA